MDPFKKWDEKCLIKVNNYRDPPPPTNESQASIPKADIEEEDDTPFAIENLSSKIISTKSMHTLEIPVEGEEPRSE